MTVHVIMIFDVGGDSNLTSVMETGMTDVVTEDGPGDDSGTGFHYLQYQDL